ncbi:MAG: exonuclease domain-containing protein [Faecalibacterium prausnitzii]|nr:exonuclease domain-containing protein [Faecalibacterium prausnitzii]
MERTEKGTSLMQIPASYTMIDTETTGLDPQYDKIIEMAAIKIRDGKEVARFETLVNPEQPIDDFIADLTGITNEELSAAPVAADCLPDFVDFIGEDIVVGHNVHFDINFIYDALLACGYAPIKNDFVDTLRLSRRVRPDLEHHRLCDMAAAYGVPQPVAHRSLADCQTAIGVLDALAADAAAREIDLQACKKHYGASASKVSDIVAHEGCERPDSPLYGKVCVFTGKLDTLTRKDAAQLVADLGGICADGVTKKTNFLIMGTNEYCPTIVGGKSTKQKKAESLILKGADLQILTENVFLDMLAE